MILSLSCWGCKVDGRGARMTAGDVTQCSIWRSDFAQVSLWAGASQVVAGGALHLSSWVVVLSAGRTQPDSLPLCLLPPFLLLNNMSVLIKCFLGTVLRRTGNTSPSLTPTTHLTRHTRPCARMHMWIPSLLSQMRSCVPASELLSLRCEWMVLFRMQVNLSIQNWIMVKKTATCSAFYRQYTVKSKSKY